MSEDGRANEVWTYIGARIGKGGKAFSCWLDPDGVTHPFGGLRNFVIGRQYTADVERKGDQLSLYGSPIFLGVEENPWPSEKIETWKHLDFQARAKIEATRLERKQGKPELEVVSAAQALAQKCRTRRELEALIAHMNRSMSEAWIQREK